MDVLSAVRREAMPVKHDPVLRVHRDLVADELWEPSLARSRLRRSEAAPGVIASRSLVSRALTDLDGPAAPTESGGDGRNLGDPELWDFSAACARARRQAAEPCVLPQARIAGVTMVVAAVAAALPAPSGAAGRARAAEPARSHVEILRLGSRGPAVVR